MKTMDMTPGKLYIRTYFNLSRGLSNQEEMTAYSLKGNWRLLLRVENHSSGERTVSGGWKTCNPHEELGGDLREATDEEIENYLNLWGGNGHPLTLIFSKEHLPGPIASFLAEMWMKRIDRYHEEGKEVPYGYTPPGYNRFRNKTFLWKMLSIGVLNQVRGLGGTSLFLPGDTVRLMENIGSGLANPQFTVETHYRWRLEHGHDYYEKGDITEIINSAPNEVSVALRDLRGVMELRLHSGDDDLSRMAYAQKALLEECLAERAYNAFKKALDL